MTAIKISDILNKYLRENPNSVTPQIRDAIAAGLAATDPQQPLLAAERDARSISGQDSKDAPKAVICAVASLPVPHAGRVQAAFLQVMLAEDSKIRDHESHRRKVTAWVSVLSSRPEAVQAKLAPALAVTLGNEKDGLRLLGQAAAASGNTTTGQAIAAQAFDLSFHDITPEQQALVKQGHSLRDFPGAAARTHWAQKLTSSLIAKVGQKDAAALEEFGAMLDRLAALPAAEALSALEWVRDKCMSILPATGPVYDKAFQILFAPENAGLQRNDFTTKPEHWVAGYMKNLLHADDSDPARSLPLLERIKGGKDATRLLDSARDALFDFSYDRRGNDKKASVVKSAVVEAGWTRTLATTEPAKYVRDNSDARITWSLAYALALKSEDMSKPVIQEKAQGFVDRLAAQGDWKLLLEETAKVGFAYKIEGLGDMAEERLAQGPIDPAAKLPSGSLGVLAGPHSRGTQLGGTRLGGAARSDLALT